MANTRVITSFLDYTPTATSEADNFLDSNLEDITFPLRPWKATVATGIVDVTLDFASALNGLAADAAIFLNDLNITSVRIQGNTSSSWGSPPWDQLVTIAKDRWNGRYKGFFRLADLAAPAFAYRYLNIRIPSQTPVDALPYRIGTIVVGQMTELTVNPSAILQRTRHDPLSQVDFSNGRIEVGFAGEPFVQLQYPRKLYTVAALNEQLDLDALGRHSAFVIWDAALNASQYAWLVLRTEAVQLGQRFVNVHEGTWALREVT
jgi:hypothetical protein